MRTEFNSHTIAIALDTLRQHSGPVLVGFSGGLDSSVLLHLLNHETALVGRLRAIHIHHGLHPQADAWEQHCQTICSAWQIPLTCIRVEVHRHCGDGLEAAARNARHAAFVGAMETDSILALAHHQDDQAETVLMRALRGSGVDGLAAMRPWRAFASGWLWRPLLALPRAHLLDYARAHRLRWIEDSSNTDTVFDRNYLRHDVMPRLTARWPHAAARLAHVATLQAQAHELLDADTHAHLADCMAGAPDILSVSRLHQFSPQRRARMLRLWVARLGLPPLPGHALARIEADLLTQTPGPHARFRWRQAALTRWRDLLHAGAVTAPLSPEFTCAWHPHTPLRLPDGSQLALSMPPPIPADLCWQVHARRGGERIVLPGRSHSHSLKHVLQQRAVPPWIRARLPLVSDLEGELLAAGGYICSARFSQWLHARQARLIWA